MNPIRIMNAWRLVQGCALAVLIAGVLVATDIPIRNIECEVCRANFPEWLCWWPCLFGN